MERDIAEKLLEEMARLRGQTDSQPDRALICARQERDLALEASGIGLWRLNLARNEVTWDDVAREMLGRPGNTESARAEDLLMLVHPEDQATVREHGERTHATGRYADISFRIVRGERTRWILCKGKVLQGPDGRPAEWLGGLLDVTCSRELDSDRGRIQKLEAVAQLAGGVAHEFNNLLLAIMGNLEMAKRASGDKRALLVDQAMVACVRAADLTRELLAFGRREPLPDTLIDCNELLDETAQTLRLVLPKDIKLDLLCAHRLPLVLADRAQLQQVISNLCTNARDAMPGGGRLVVESETVVINSQFRESHPWARPGRYVLLSVTDTGTGIPVSEIDRVFDPFFTSKESGSGLGLASVYGIVKRHGGLVHVYSEVRKGTTFKVYLPVSERQASVVGTKLEEPVRGGTETILVAEDEEPVRGVVVRVLASAGYRVLEARDGVEAVDLFTAHLTEVDLVLMDSVMPRRAGAEAVGQIRSLAPDAKIIISSGYTESMGADGLAGPAVQFLAKPYDPDALLRVIRRTLDVA